MDLSAIVNKRKQYTDYIVKEITHICQHLPKRDPGSEGERLACEYMADMLKNDCGCEEVFTEQFSEHPHSFFGWITVDVLLCLAAIALLFFTPVVSLALLTLAVGILVLQFGLYKKIVDFLFPKKIGHNVTAIKHCTGEVKRRIFFNGHPDAC